MQKRRLAGDSHITHGERALLRQIAMIVTGNNAGRSNFHPRVCATLTAIRRQASAPIRDSLRRERAWIDRQISIMDAYPVIKASITKRA
jgi:hypothetical protein